MSRDPVMRVCLSVGSPRPRAVPTFSYVPICACVRVCVCVQPAFQASTHTHTQAQRHIGQSYVNGSFTAYCPKPFSLSQHPKKSRIITRCLISAFVAHKVFREKPGILFFTTNCALCLYNEQGWKL